MKTFQPGQNVTFRAPTPQQGCAYCGAPLGRLPKAVKGTVERAATPADVLQCDECFKVNHVAPDAYFVRVGDQHVFLPAAALVG